MMITNIEQLERRAEMEEHEYRHFLLYAKGHYTGAENYMEGFRKCLAHYTGCDPEHESDSDVIEFMWMVACKFAREYDRNEFVKRVILKYWPNDSDDVKDRFLIWVRNVLVSVPVMNGEKLLIELGDADPDVMPLSDGGKKRAIRRAAACAD
jgi:hypothetical protein